MKATVNNNSIMVPEVSLIQPNNMHWVKDFSLAGFSKEDDKYILSIFSLLFTENKTRIFLKDDKIIIVTSEKVNNESSGVFLDWQMYQQNSYVRMRSFNILLPGDNFYLIKHYYVPNEFMLKIILGRQMVQ